MRSFNLQVICLLLLCFSCGQEKKQPKPAEESVIKEVEAPTNSASVDAIIDLLDAGKNIQTGATGFTVLITKDKILCFKKESEVSDSDLDDSVIVSLFYFNKKQKQLAFNMIDVSSENFDYNGESYYLAEFPYTYEEDISTIQVGQYSKAEAKTTWSLSVSRNLIKK